MKIGMYVDGVLVGVYVNYLDALEDAKFAFEETGVPHEIKLIKED